MQAVLISIVAVAGTLLGSYLTYRLQRRTAKQAGDDARWETRRLEVLEAVAGFASKASVQQRVEFNRAKGRISGIASAAREEARQEAYQSRAETYSAYYRLRLLVDPDLDRDLVDGAQNLIELLRQISALPESENELHKYSHAATKALDKVVECANLRLREGYC